MTLVERTTDYQEGLNTPRNVMRYYKDAAEGYEGYYDMRCHFGFTPDGSTKPYNLAEAQHAMQVVLGKALNVPSGSIVLDAGCGYGPVARTLQTEFGLNVVGVDLMPTRLLKAQELNEMNPVTNHIALARADYHDLPFDSDSFDGVFTMETAVHADPIENLLAEFYRVLKPGGHLVMHEYSIPPLETVPGPIRTLAQKVIDRTAMTSLNRFTHGIFEELLTKAGFINTYAVDISKNVFPTWRHTFKNALANTAQQITTGSFSLDNIQGTTLIYPARHKLGYNVISGEKPE